MKRLNLACAIILFLLACRKTDRPVTPPSKPDSTTVVTQTITPAPLDSAQQILEYYRTIDTVLYRRAFLTCYNLDGSVKWTDDLGGEVLSNGASFANGVIYTGGSYFYTNYLVPNSPVI
jgi:hypothetical protein